MDSAISRGVLVLRLGFRVSGRVGKYTRASVVVIRRRGLASATTVRYTWWESVVTVMCIYWTVPCLQTRAFFLSEADRGQGRDVQTFLFLWRWK